MTKRYPEREGEATQPRFDEVYPPPLRDGEEEILRRRRESAELAWSRDQLVGFGLSGGGIRSATFSLGLFQGMAAVPGLLRQIDFLSTVSGGGYFGSFFGRLLTRKTFVKTPDDVEKILLGKEYPEVLQSLRENGRYLSPNGSGDSLLFGSVILRNLVSVHIVLGVLVLSLFLALQCLRASFHAYLVPNDDSLVSNGMIWWSPVLLLPLLVFAFFAFPLGWSYWLAEPESDAIKKGGAAETKASETSEIAPMVGLFFTLVISTLLLAMTHGQRISWLWGSIAIAALVTWICRRLVKRLIDFRSRSMDTRSPDAARPQEAQMEAALQASLTERNLLSVWLSGSLIVTGVLLALALVDSLGQTLYLKIVNDEVRDLLAAVVLGLSVLAGFAQRIAVFFAKGADGERPSLPLKWVATVAALVLVTLWLVCLNAASHAIAWGLQEPRSAVDRPSDASSEDDSHIISLVIREGGRDLVMAMRALEDQSPDDQREAKSRDLWFAFLGFSGTFLLSILFGQTWPFVNRSTHQPIYGARLTRAYLGASNQNRWHGKSITHPLPGDDHDLASYWPPPSNNAAPIHLINVTINETVAGRSQIQQQDRKGVGMALGPRGLTAGVCQHAVMPLGEDRWMNPEGAPVAVFPASKKDHHVFRYEPEGRALFTGEMLPLGTWLSISGAAFSTGTGMRTSLGLCLLAGLGNVRLGRWWDSGVRPFVSEDRKLSLRLEDVAARVFPVQTHLLGELFARFPGTARRHWYLSDGGHFENLGGYELIRRRLPLIVIVDAEMDPNYSFEGLANLVRKVRLDFNAEVDFLSEKELDRCIAKRARRCVGTISQLRPTNTSNQRNGGHRSEAHAALARVTYQDTIPRRTSWLLYVKPTLKGDEPIDVVEYQRNHPQFPHEPTSDQFFDESQWESYRRLGQHIAESLFDNIEAFLPVEKKKCFLTRHGRRR